MPGFIGFKEESLLRKLMRLFFIALVTVMLSSCDAEEDKPVQSLKALVVPEEFQQGESAFNLYCLNCHGKHGTGTDKGPPFIDKIYEPNHHGDMSFLLAVKNGVKAHHWRFGDMPKILGVSKKEVIDIVAYVRWLQRDAGIY